MRALPLFVPIVMVSSALQGPVRADDLTCKLFRVRLASDLRGGGATLSPFAFSAGLKTETTPHMAYTFTTNDRMTGNLECYDADALREFDVVADFKGLPPKDAPAQIAKLRTVAASALCAIEATLTKSRCASIVSTLFARLQGNIKLQTDRRDPLPAADEYISASEKTELNASAVTDSMQLSIFVKAGHAGR